jgi:hypothetical protein
MTKFTKTTPIPFLLAIFFVSFLLLSCNPWRSGSTIKGANAKTKYHSKTASSKRHK